MSGGGSSDNDFTGAAIVKTATMNGHFKFHYDEDLANYGPGRGYIVTTWNEMAPQAVAQFNIEDYYKETYQDTVVYY